MGIMLPGEVGGWVKPWTNWTEHLTARIGFGQSVAVTQLGMTVAYAAVVNEGRLMRPLLVRRLVSPEGRVVRQIEPVCVRQVLRPEATRETVKALTAATHAPFTGRLAGSDRYPPGGKTSTAQVPITKDSRLGRGAAPVGATAAYPTAQAQARGYRRDVVNVSFYGHAPADRPKVVISVTLDEVDRSQTGGHAAAPVFRAIIEQTLACLGVPPGVQPERRGGLQLAGGVGERRDTFPTSR
jgi:cell division protein FtsI/penicillin-binding protein 2